MTAYEVIEYVSRQEDVIYNLKNLLYWLVAERMDVPVNSKETRALGLVIDKLISTSKKGGPIGEEYPAWDKLSVEKELILLWEYIHRRKHVLL